MLTDATATACFSTDSIDKAKEFYQGVLRIRCVVVDTGSLVLDLAEGSHVLIYLKEDHQASNYTTLILSVDDLRPTVRALREKGVEIAALPGTDEDGISTDEGMPPTAWFTDPAGNWIAVGERVPMPMGEL